MEKDNTEVNITKEGISQTCQNSKSNCSQLGMMLPAPQGNSCPSLETFLVVTTVKEEEDAHETLWAEARDGPEHATMHRTAPPQRMIQPQMSPVMRLRSPVLELWFFMFRSPENLKEAADPQGSSCASNTMQM